MIVNRKIPEAQLNAFFQGTYRLGGTNGTNSAGSPVLTSAGALFQTRGTQVGDRVYISGALVATVYTVLSVDSETQITLSANIVAAHTANAVFRVHQNNGFGDPAGLKVIYPLEGDTWFLMWDSATFGPN